MLLGAFGADVLKIEHPRGDPARGHGPSKDGVPLWWKLIARNKRAITLYLGSLEGQAIFRRLASEAWTLQTEQGRLILSRAGR